MNKHNKMSNLETVKSYLNGEKSSVTVGYEPTKEKKHKDGETWKDGDGKEWIQKGAGKISKNLYDTKEITRQVCPICKKDVSWSSNPNDEKIFHKTGKCYDCVIEEETKMMIDGTFGIYEKIKIIRNQKSFLKELKQKIEESIEWLNNKTNKIEYFNEDGTTDTWTDISRDNFLKESEKDLKEVDKSLILCDESVLMLEEKLSELRSK
jgi:hypothetical protein